MNFKQIILILTTNTGSRESSKRSMGFGKEEFEDRSREAIDRFFSPEFRNRLDAIINFNSLDIRIVEKIVDKIVGQLSDRLKAKKVSIEFSPEARTYIAKKGYNRQLGARPIQRLIDNEITERLSKEILFGEISSGGKVNITLKNGKLKFDYVTSMN